MNAHRIFASVSGSNFLDGQFQTGGVADIPVIDPATETEIGIIAEPSATALDSAVEAANRAQRVWWRKSALDRAAMLHEISSKLQSLSPLLAEAMTREMGKPYRESIWEPGASANAFSYYAELAKHDGGRVAGPAVAGQIHLTLKEPLGVVVCVVPYNFPILLFAWATAAALAAGNAVMIKPSDLTSLTTLLCMKAFDHLPPGLVQVATGGPAVGKTLVSHKNTHGVAFTGSIANGQAVARTCADMFKPALIEASGNDAFIVMPSAPIDVAARGGAFAAFLNCGQVCTSAERFYVHEAIYEDFVARISKIATSMRVGSGLDAVDMGPFAAKRERDRYEPLIANAIKQGARVVAGGRRPSNLNRGWFVEPTVLSDVDPRSAIVNDEPFGPVAPIVRVRSLDEAIELANNSKYGLGANIYTHDLTEAMRAVHEIQTGIVWVNTPLNDNDAVPFGGRKMSGIGRELGSEGLEQFRHSKMAIIAPQALMNDEWYPYPEEPVFEGDKS